MLLDIGLTAPGTYSAQSGPTYYGAQGDKSTLGIFAIPTGLGHGVKHCRVAWKAGRALQLIPRSTPRDHVPVVLAMLYESPVMLPQNPRPRWDHNKLAEALQNGAHRDAFHHELEREMLAQASFFCKQYRERPTHRSPL